MKIRETGRIEEQGSLKFLGRTIYRRKGSKALFLQVDPAYLNGAFEEFGITKGTSTFPDLRPAIEETVGENPISAESHARFRRVLGRLAWLGQTRQDILVLIGMLSTGQASPRPGHEKAMRQVLRFMKESMNFSQRFPSEEFGRSLLVLEVFTDAGFAPMRSLQRRSITGVVFVFDKLFEGFFTPSNIFTLSSCEAELVALQSGVQEGLGLVRTLSFLLRQLCGEKGMPMRCVAGELPLVVKTDSLSGKMLLEGSDLQRRSRHIDIKVSWLRELLSKQVMSLEHVPGSENPADCFTKCLPTQQYSLYRSILGFVASDFTIIHLLLDESSFDETYDGILSAFSTKQCCFCGESLIERGEECQKYQNMILSLHLDVSSKILQIMKSFGVGGLIICLSDAAVSFVDLSGGRSVRVHLFELMAGNAPENHDMASTVSTRVDYTTGNRLREPSTGHEPSYPPTEIATEIPILDDEGKPAEPHLVIDGAEAINTNKRVPVMLVPAKPAVKKMPVKPLVKKMPKKVLFVDKMKRVYFLKTKTESEAGSVSMGSKMKECRKSAAQLARKKKQRLQYKKRIAERKIGKFFDPKTGEAVSVEVGQAHKKPKIRRSFSGFHRGPLTKERCMGCKEKGICWLTARGAGPGG